MDIDPAHYFILQDGRAITSLEELARLLKDIPQELFEYHVTETKNDFSNWIRYVFKNRILADAIFPFEYKRRAEIITLIKKYLATCKILILNAGNNWIKFRIFEMQNRDILLTGHINTIGAESTITFASKKEELTITLPLHTHVDATNYIFQLAVEQDVIGDAQELKAIGHRVTDGGETQNKPLLITIETMKYIEQLSYASPLQHRATLQCMQTCIANCSCKNIAVFDTAFHLTIPKTKYLYAIPYEYYEKHGIRKYGFHGSRFRYITKRMQEYYALQKKKKNTMIICHLGVTTAITAVKNGKSFNTSMGFTALDGPIMQTRSGSLDPGAILYLERYLKMTPEQIEELLIKYSGVEGICQKTIPELMKNTKGEKESLALHMYVDSIVRHIGAYAAEMNGVDVIVFTGTIGEEYPALRKQILNQFTFLGVKLHDAYNAKNAFIISKSDSKIDCVVIPTNEELQIAMEVSDFLKKK